MACPIAMPAPSPAPTPAAPPPSFRRRDGNRLSNFVLRVPAHVADHVHADTLIKDLLQFVRQRQIFDHETVERQTELGESRFELIGDFFESAT